MNNTTSYWGGLARILLCGTLVALTHPHAAGAGRSIPLDEVYETFTCTQGWGMMGVNTAAHAPGTAALPLRIGDTHYERGLGHHAPGELLIPLEGNYLSFKAEVGLQWQGGGRGSVVFEAWVDGEKRFDSGLMTDDDGPRPLELALEDASELRLVVTDGGDGLVCDMANWADAHLVRATNIPHVGTPIFAPNERPLPEVFMEGSFALAGHSEGSQFAFARPLGYCTIITDAGEQSRISLPIHAIEHPFTIRAEVAHAGGAPATLRLGLHTGDTASAPLAKGRVVMAVSGDGATDTDTFTLEVIPSDGATAVRLLRVAYHSGNRMTLLNFMPTPVAMDALPTPPDILPHPLLGNELVEWDWHMQDGIGAGATRNTFAEATKITLDRGDALLERLMRHEAVSDKTARAWQEVRHTFNRLRRAQPTAKEAVWESLWRAAHTQRRQLLFAHPLARTGALVFVKQAPGIFSHQLTQYYGRYARPGGGIYVVDAPGEAMHVRPLAEDLLPEGSYMQPKVSHDGQRILFAFCNAETTPEDMLNGSWGRHYHIYDMDANGTRIRQLTEGAYDDFAPVELPDGAIMFISTRRGGWHRCGGLGCPLYTLTRMHGDGTNIRTVSYHETQEWDPTVLNDGRVIYTRWDYVDRHAVHYQQLWTVHPDGTGPTAFYGNHTLNPMGVWEPRAVPGSRQVMATAAAHHAMTAGSIILIDPAVGVDGLAPITRLTPHVPFPESEAMLLPHWRSEAPETPPKQMPETERWPWQCYRSPWPLSEDLFLAAYSYDPLMGEPNPNVANMFGLYLVDAFGNKELIYRDLNISSLWPVPLRPRIPEPDLPSKLEEDAPHEGTYYVQDVYQSSQPLPEATITALRILQVLPKSTPIANVPTLGAPNASPGKQVLGTVPVEADGSAYFRAPAGIPLNFQALDPTGQAVQIMRSASYLQPGEQASCVGCHEPRLAAPPAEAVMPIALRRPPSEIAPGPDGSLPFSYPLLVQPVLDKHCIHCHGDDDAKGPEAHGPIRLTGVIEGRYTVSYNTLANRVSYAAWGRGVFPDGNSEPTTQPDFFGARGSALMQMLLEGHQDVQLDLDDLERLITWMDGNALFYGTFNFEDQKRQQHGERISGPDLE